MHKKSFKGIYLGIYGALNKLKVGEENRYRWWTFRGNEWIYCKSVVFKTSIAYFKTHLNYQNDLSDAYCFFQGSQIKFRGTVLCAVSIFNESFESKSTEDDFVWMKVSFETDNKLQEDFLFILKILDFFEG